MKWVLFVVCLVLSGAIKSNERWECKDLTAPNWNNIVLRLVAQPDDNIGVVLASGDMQYTSYDVVGIDRRWDFGHKEPDSFRYAILMQPNGVTAYYDFSGKSSTTPSQRFDCRSYE